MTASPPPPFPAGEYSPPADDDDTTQANLVAQLEEVPARARLQVDGLSERQLDTKYRNWTIRQIIHHLADSHLNCYVRYKWALTEPTPTIKTYDESRWSEVVDATTAPLESSLRMLEGLHARWAALIRLLDAEQMESGFFHPELDRVVTLREALPNYVWHSNHHLAQIAWVRDQHGW